jgi:iron(III) transport system substrate-binding protein
MGEEKMKRRATLRSAAAFAAGLTCLAIVAGCGSSSSSSSGSTGGSAPAAKATTGSNGQLELDGETVAGKELVEKAKAEGSLTVYTAFSQQSEEYIAEAFTEATGVDVNVVYLTTDALVTRLQTESKGGQYTADVTNLGDPSNLSSLSKGGDLATYTPPASFHLPASAKQEGGQYWAFTQSPMTIAYNTAEVSESEVPKSWEDIFKPEWKGKIGTSPLGAGGIELAMYQFLRNEISPESWEKLAAQDPSIQDTMTSTASAIESGSSPIGLVAPSGLNEALEQGAQVSFVAEPEGGLPLSPIFTAEVAHAPHPEAAQLYLDFLFSKAGQSVLAEKIGDYGIRSDVPPPAVGGIKLPALSSGYTFYSVPTPEGIEQGETWSNEWNKVFHYSS